MKGKGKGKEQSDAKDCPLQFPDFTPIDHSRHCPKYSSVLQRKEDEAIGLEDIEFLQVELESLLVAVTKRRNQLEDEMQVLVTWQDKKDKKASEKSEPESSGKRGCPSDGKPNKKFKDNTGKTHPVANIGRPKSKNNQRTRLQEYEFVDSPLDVPKSQKNDSPNRFWAFVEPYCAEITQDDIKMIEEWIKTHDDDSEYQKIPPLGNHFAYKWTQEDIQDEIKEGSKTVDRRKGLSNNSSLNSVDGEKLLKKAEKDYDSDDGSPFGPLTQRLVSCLIEENLMTSLEDSMTDSKESTDANVTAPSAKANFIKSLNIGNTVQLEKRLRKELTENGILDADDMETSSSDDELLTELKKLQNALKPVSAYNLSQKKRLLKLSKEEICRQEIKKKLQVADAEVMEAQKKIAFAKQKDKAPTKKERDQALKALKEREALIKQLQNMNAQ